MRAAGSIETARRNRGRARPQPTASAGRRARGRGVAPHRAAIGARTTQQRGVVIPSSSRRHRAVTASSLRHARTIHALARARVRAAAGAPHARRRIAQRAPRAKHSRSAPPQLAAPATLLRPRVRQQTPTTAPRSQPNHPMTRRLLANSFPLAALALAAVAPAQYVTTYDTATDRLIMFNPADGSLVGTTIFQVPNTVQVSAIDVNGEIWVSEQTGDRVVRYDANGNVLGVIGPTFVGGGFDNIRGMVFANGVVYVTNDGANNGATADSLVSFDAAGNHLQTVVLPSSTSPFSVIPFQGDLLIVSSGANDDVHRYTTAGVSLGTFHNSTAIDFGHQGIVASDGNVWVATFTSDTLVKLDATNGANVLQTIPASGARGVHELPNGNMLWTNGSGVWLYDVVTTTSTLVFAGACYHLNPVLGANAHHLAYGQGCHSFEKDDSNVFEFFPDMASAKAALDGHAMTFTLTPGGYVANWVPNGATAYVAPTAGAVIIANGDSVQTAITPSAAIPVPGGVETTWTVSSNGILTAGNPGNQTTSGTPTLSSTATATRLAFYTWANHNPAETGSGKAKWEEVAGVLYVTFDGVEFGGTPTVAPSTFQFQVDMATGQVTMLWVSMSASTATTDVLVGCTLANASLTPVSEPLAAVANRTLQQDRSIAALQLTAGPAPVINPSTTVTYTVNNIPEAVPGSGVYVSAIFFSVTPVLPGIDLTGILTTVPGCRGYLASLDLGFAAVTAGPTSTTQFTFTAPPFAPGMTVASQAIALFDAAFPLLNGEAGGFTASNGLLSVVRAQ
jgi:hypothetical protein